jgi:phosphatidylglycerol:prolipoprotein diacylglycerol transferase
MALLPLLYAPVRFPLDYLRDDDATYVGLTPGQWGSIALLGVGAFVMWYIHTHPEPTLPKETRWPPEEEEGEKKSAPSPSTKKGSKKKKKAKA